ncbi:uncharacterized protein [Panulirus ornatus]|uniref:uncharacterized protein n=1 Tax=Panulirus ornatus TaxID=150431 RepID=UPI003A8C6B74
MTGRRVTLSPPGTHRDLTRGNSCSLGERTSHPPAGSCHRTLYPFHSHQGSGEVQRTSWFSLTWLLLRAVLLLTHGAGAELSVLTPRAHPLSSNPSVVTPENHPLPPEPSVLTAEGHPLPTKSSVLTPGHPPSPDPSVLTVGHPVSLETTVLTPGGHPLASQSSVLLPGGHPVSWERLLSVTPAAWKFPTPRWRLSESQSLTVPFTPFQASSATTPAPEVTVINIWNTPPTLFLKLANNKAHTSVGSSLMTKTQMLKPLISGEPRQHQQEMDNWTTTSLSRSTLGVLDSGQGCHPCTRRPHTSTITYRREDLVSYSGHQRKHSDDAGDSIFTKVSRPLVHEPKSNTIENAQLHAVDLIGQIEANAWLSQKDNKPIPLQFKSRRHSLPGTQEPAYNNEEIRINLDSNKTGKKTHQVRPFPLEAVIDKSVVYDPPAHTSRTHSSISPLPSASPKAETQAETPLYFSLGPGVARKNVTHHGSSLFPQETWREGLSYQLEGSSTHTTSDSASKFELVKGEPSPESYRMGREMVVEDDEGDDEDDCSNQECQDEEEATGECQGEELAGKCHDEEGDSIQTDDPETEEHALVYDLTNRLKRRSYVQHNSPMTNTVGGLAGTTALFYRRKRKIDMLEMTVVEGGLAALPCDLDVKNPKDSVQLILWIKEGIHTPLYSYDYRELLGGRPKETKPDANSTLAKRTTFRTDSSPAALLVERVEAEDSGVYRCRVDFLLTPTRNKRVNLTVIVPPSRARVSWSLGNSGVMPVEERIVGPFLEGAEPSLICSNDDGWPPPAVLWYEGDDVLDDSYTVDQTTVENDLSLGPLTRGDLGRRLTCLASNTNKTQPATTTVTLAMTLSIVGVRVDEVASVWAAERAEVQCKVWGSRPPPTVVWWLGSVMLPPTHTKVLEEGNLTVSVLHFTPKPQDDGAMLICQATNEKLPDQAVQDSRLLSVSYLPLVNVHLGRSLDPLRIKEGDDVYFECSVKAKPAIFKVAWKHNDIELLAGDGVFVSNMSLVVQRVTRAHGGNYTCEATNIKGTSSSPPLHLDVKYAPVCAQQQKVQHSVAKLENAEISCRVHANPPTVTFRWTFNNTAEAIDVPDGRFVVVGTESRVNYTPMNELDYGTLLCWANNTIGIQDHPCVFHIVAAGKPDPPHNCRVFDVTISSLQVTCLAGDDGGLTQNFLLQVYQIGSTSPVVEVTRASPSFSVANLRPATAYKIIIAAINDKGASRVTELKAYTVRVPETREETSAEPTRDRDRGSSVPLALVVGGVVTGVPLVVVIAVLLWLRLFRRSTAGGARERRLSTNSKDGASTDLPSEASPPDDRNPDLISHTPDPGEDTDQCGEIATITTSSTFFLHNGGPSYPATAAAAGASTTTAAATAAPTTVGGGAEYTQLVCPEPLHAPAPNVAHTHGHTPAAAVSHVPYFPDSQQPQVLDVPLPPPASYNQGYPGSERDYQAAASQCYSTLERKRRQQGCQKSYSHPEEYQQGTYDSTLQNPFPHLYQGPGGGYCQTPHGSQYNLAQYQGSLTLGSPTQSLQGTLRRGSKKLHKASAGIVPTHPHHHHCEVHESNPPLEPDPGQMDSTLKRERRREVQTCEVVEVAENDSQASTPSTVRRSKRESAV